MATVEAVPFPSTDLTDTAELASLAALHLCGIGPMPRRDWVDGELGRPKSRASKAPVEMHETLAALLQVWRPETPYSKDSDFVFPSFKLHGKQPRLGSMIVQGYIRPAAVAARVIAEDCPRFGFHNLRHGLSTLLIENGHDPVVVQRMLRQSHVDMTMHYVDNSHKARNA